MKRKAKVKRSTEETVIITKVFSFTLVQEMQMETQYHFHPSVRKRDQEVLERAEGAPTDTPGENVNQLSQWPDCLLNVIAFRRYIPSTGPSADTVTRLHQDFRAEMFTAALFITAKEQKCPAVH